MAHPPSSRTNASIAFGGTRTQPPSCAIAAGADISTGTPRCVPNGCWGRQPWISIPSCWRALQFAFTIAFHIIFPSFTIGLSAYIATLDVTAWWTGRDRFLRIAGFWTRILAVSFGMGVVSGVVLSYELGTNWSRFSRSPATSSGRSPATRC